MKTQRYHTKELCCIILKIYFSGLLFLTLILTQGCNKFEYSPYQTDGIKKPENLNNLNISKLLADEWVSDDTVVILFTGDSQRFYNSLDALVAKTNSISSIDMLILSGDITDFGLLQEFLWVYERLEKLNVPYLCVIGNHDLTTNGSIIYEEMFGPKNFSFSYKGYKFLFHDTNGREYNFNGTVPDITWLSGQLNDASAQWFVGVSHVPPYNEDFDNNLEVPYLELFASRPEFILSLHGHLHGSLDMYIDHVRYITSYAMNDDECILLKLFNGNVSKEVIYY